MQNTSDMELLNAYARTNSEEAFAEIVSRYTNLVYSIAVRQVQDPFLAEEVTQAVFIVLARKAGSLSPRVVLSGWLCRTARYASANALTIQRRRQRHEEELTDAVQEPMENEVWNQISPMLDAAMEHLGANEHDALVLRFFEGCNFKEIGGALNTSEDAAKMRVSRGLEKLRKFFTKRGLTLTTAVIAETVAANSVQGAPAALAKSATAIAISKGSIATATTLTLTKATMKGIMWMKFKFPLAISMAILLTTATATLAPAPSKAPTSTSYSMKGNLTWQFSTNKTTYPIEIWRDGPALRMTLLWQPNYFATGFLCTRDMALSFSQFTKDLARVPKTYKASNNGNVDISHYRMPDSSQLAPIWMVIKGREEFESINYPVSIFPGIGETLLHERPTVNPVTQFEPSWPSGFSSYADVVTNTEDGYVQSTIVTVDSWTNCAGIKFPATLSMSMTRKATWADVSPEYLWDVKALFQVTVITGLQQPVDTRIPFFSTVTDWRPREDGRSEYGCGYDTTNGVIFDEPLKIHYRPARDWAQSQGLKKGTIAPDFSGTTIDGKEIKLSDFRGKYLVLTFWSTTCGPCIGQMPKLKETYSVFNNNPRFAMIGIALDSPERVAKFTKDKGITWPQIALSDEFANPICKDYKVTGIPTDYIIDPDGKTIAQFYGFDKGYIESLLSK